MTNSERTELLQEAQGLIETAIEQIRYATMGTSQERHIQAYLTDQLENLNTGINPYDLSIQKLIEDIETGELYENH